MENLIKIIRKMRGWTQETLAQESGLSVSIISAYERGTREYTLKTLAPLARALGVTAADLITKENSPLNAAELVEVLLEKVAKETEDEAKRKRIEQYLNLIRMELSQD
jgi:transcriptional regulator with XRE-family HTH domain